MRHILVLLASVCSLAAAEPAVTNIPGRRVMVVDGLLKVSAERCLFDGASLAEAALVIGLGGTLEIDHWFARKDLSLGTLPGDAARITVDGGRLRVTGVTGSGRGMTIGTRGATFEAAAGADWLMHDLKDAHDFVFIGEPPLTFTGAGRGRFDKAVSRAGKILKDGTGEWIIDSPKFDVGTVEVRQGLLEMTRPVLPDTQTVTVAAGAKLFLRFDGGDAVGGLVLGEEAMTAGTYNAKTHPSFLAGPGSLVVGGPAVVAPPALTYRFQNVEDVDAKHRQAIETSMDYAEGLFNQYAWFPKKISVSYNRGVRTADTAYYKKSIRFGGIISRCSAMHELSHAMGTGTHWKWRQFSRDRRWTGARAVAFLWQIDGPGAVLHVDRIHYWPYGANYPKESNAVNDRIQVRLIEALCRDMGIY